MVKKNKENKMKEFKIQFLDRMSTLLISAFGLVAALAWNKAIQDWFASNEALVVYGPWAYAVTVTIIAVFAILWISKITEKLKN